jgi:hypothetical protein
VPVAQVVVSAGVRAGVDTPPAVMQRVPVCGVVPAAVVCAAPPVAMASPVRV